MKLATFEVDGQARTGVVTAEGALLDLVQASGAPVLATMQSIIEHEERSLPLIADLPSAGWRLCLFPIRSAIAPTSNCTTCSRWRRA